MDPNIHAWYEHIRHSPLAQHQPIRHFSAPAQRDDGDAVPEPALSPETLVEWQKRYERDCDKKFLTDEEMERLAFMKWRMKRRRENTECP